MISKQIWDQHPSTTTTSSSVAPASCSVREWQHIYKSLCSWVILQMLGCVSGRALWLLYQQVVNCPTSTLWCKRRIWHRRWTDCETGQGGTEQTVLGHCARPPVRLKERECEQAWWMHMWPLTWICWTCCISFTAPSLLPFVFLISLLNLVDEK